MRRILYSLFFLCSSFSGAAQQLFSDTPRFTKVDSIRGTLSPLRNCFDVQYYHLDIAVDTRNQSIKGSNLIRFKAMYDLDTLQIDLFDNMRINEIRYQTYPLQFKRSYNAAFVYLPHTIRQGSLDSIQIFYEGTPLRAQNAPWDGGFDWRKDRHGKHFIATANQGIGASLWWPNKDHLSDEPDSMLISVTVPRDLVNVSNGRLRSVDSTANEKKYNWFVSNPINNYNIALNIGDYVHFSDVYQGEKGRLDLDYWVLRDHINQAKQHFSRNVKPMLKAFEYWFGPYPFYEDSFKLIETAHLGMEHQSAIAYGNQFKNGYLGSDRSGTGWGTKWDFIIVHEAGHEWFGNSLTAADLADMWIHESFTTYSEALYIDYYYGKQASSQYVFGLRKGILNDRPMQGLYGVNHEGSSDMYNKGAVLLHMIRTMVNDDEKWRRILRGLCERYYHAQVNYQDIVHYMNTQSGLDLSSVFAQYVQHTLPPKLLVKNHGKGKVEVKWEADVSNFSMPVRVKKAGTDAYTSLHVTSVWQQLPEVDSSELTFDTQNFYFDLVQEKN